jgi:hypothetical protein
MKRTGSAILIPKDMAKPYGKGKTICMPILAPAAIRTRINPNRNFSIL